MIWIEILGAVLVGVTLGIFISALMMVSKSTKREDDGAAVLADRLLNVIKRWEHHRPGTGGSLETIGTLYEIKRHCNDALERVKNHEEDIT